jgi:hypothetical protein
MTDLFDAPDLFAVKPAAKRVRSPKAAPLPPPAVSALVGPRWPVSCMACDCGARDEVKEPAPERLDCWHCHGLETMIRIVPRYLPPATAGRGLTPHELRGMALDGVRHP